MGSVFESLWVGFAPIISGSLLPNAVRRTHESRGFLRIVLQPERQVKAIPLSLYRQRLYWRSTGA